eukprot:m.9880 g.9880  ORF g.9880 m.9880 type:complete len:670 (-) comp4158_c0_seq1:30-2039(-)
MMDRSLFSRGAILFALGYLLCYFTVIRPKEFIKEPTLADTGNARRSRAEEHINVNTQTGTVTEGEADDDDGGGSDNTYHFFLDVLNVPETTLTSTTNLLAILEPGLEHLGFNSKSLLSHAVQGAGGIVMVAWLDSVGGHIMVRTHPKSNSVLIDAYIPGTEWQKYYQTQKLIKEGFLLAQLSDISFKWSVHPRGHFTELDLYTQVLSRHGIEKILLSSTKSEYQAVDIVATTDYPEPTYLVNNGHEDMKSVAEEISSRKDPFLFLDGWTQSNGDDEKIYHESLVHPGLMAHEHGAERVAILGGGEGATLREVLKYKQIKEVVMVELDGEVIDKCRKYMPAFNNCTWASSDGKPHNCFDDDRTTLVVGDASAWFNKHYPDCNNIKEEDRFDVIILDLLDPELLNEVPFAAELYSEKFFERLNCALKPDGVLAAQLGEGASATDFGVADPLKLEVIQMISKHFLPGGFFMYETFVKNFLNNWMFGVGCKTWQCANRWRHSAARVDAELKNRLDPRIYADEHFGYADLKYFDGTTKQIMLEPRSYENLLCDFPVSYANKKQSNPCKQRPHFGKMDFRVEISQEALLEAREQNPDKDFDKFLVSLIENGLICPMSGGSITLTLSELFKAASQLKSDKIPDVRKLEMKAWMRDSDIATFDPLYSRFPFEKCRKL